jgi:2,5-dichloro-2,5-cyclohexadiene-1,4-diol dehydrogenase 1
MEIQMEPGPFDRLNMVGRVIIVTGGGSGIGEATATLLAGRGASVVIADYDDRVGSAVAGSIRDAGGRAAFIHTDVAVEDQVKRSVDYTLSEFGGLHGAFNNAGVMSKGASLVEMPLADWHRTMEVNLTGVFLCMKHQIGHMVGHGGGAVVNTSSGAGVVGFPNLLDYVASKHGVIGLTRAAAVDFSARGVRVNAILPGGTETPMLLNAMGKDAVVRAAVEGGHPIGRLGSPFEISEAVAWLLSDAASFVTGAIFAIDGGYTCV